MDDAVARAREIALKLAAGGGGASSSSTTTAGGRKSGFSSGPPVGGSPATSALAAQVLLQQLGSGNNGGLQQHLEKPSRFRDDPSIDPMTLALRIAFSLRQTPRASQKIYVPNEPGVNFMGLLLGPRGATLKDMTDRTGARIIIRGRGSHKDGASDKFAAEDEDEPMHVLVDGPEDSVMRATQEVNALLFDPESRLQLKQQQLSALGVDDGAMVAMTPANPWQVHPNPPRLGETTFECKVPNTMVGLIIGRGGENIKRLQADHGVRIQIAKEPEPPELREEGQPSMRRIAVTGNSRSLENTRGEIEEVLRSRPAYAGGLGGGGGQYGGSGRCELMFKIANDKVGLVIGKSGMTIRGIQERTGANVRVPPTADADDPLGRTLHITADTDEQNLAAKSEIEVLINEELAKQQGVVGSDTILFPVPESCVGLVIGKGGETIHRLQAATGCRIQIPNQAEPGSMPPVRAIQISGTPNAQHMAQIEISQLVAQHESKHGSAAVLPSSPPIDPFSQPGYMGDPYAVHWQQQQQQDPHAAAAAAAQWQQQQPGGVAPPGALDPNAAYWGYQMPPGENAGFDPSMLEAQQQQMSQVTDAVAGGAQSGSEDPAAKRQKPNVETNENGNSEELAPDAYYQDFWNYAGWYGEEMARQVYAGYAPPPGSKPPPGAPQPAVDPPPGTAPPASNAVDATAHAYQNYSHTSAYDPLAAAAEASAQQTAS